MKAALTYMKIKLKEFFNYWQFLAAIIAAIFYVGMLYSNIINQSIVTAQRLDYFINQQQRENENFEQKIDKITDLLLNQGRQ